MLRLFPTLSLLIAASTLAPAAAAQDLRRALVAADLVAVARQIGKTAFSDDIDLHHLQLVDVLRAPAAAPTTVTVLDWPKLSLHNRPSPRQGRLYCLHDATREARRLGLPDAGGPYYRMNAQSGTNPLVGADLGQDPVIQFARVLTAAERGAAPATTAAALVATALGAEPVTRLEATRHLAEQPLLRRNLVPVQWSRLLARATAETDAIDYKIALVELCAEQRLDGVVDAVILGLGSVHDIAFVRTAGRVCAALRGDDAAQLLLQRMQSIADQDTRNALLLAIGATQTGPALDALLRIKESGSVNASVAAVVDAALTEHGSQRAKDAILHGRKDEKGAK